MFFIPPHSPYATVVLHHILGVLETLCVPVAVHKMEGPATMVTFLGIEVDTVRLELRLPIDKL